MKGNNPGDWVHGSYLIGNATAVNTTISKGKNEISGLVSYSPSTAQGILLGEKFLGDYLSGRVLILRG
jgi:hypothetical protein